MAKKALIAMSGGVDSSVAALLMKRAGWDCIGVTMRLFDREDLSPEASSSPDAPDTGPAADERSCCSLEDTEDARSVARKIGIPYYVFNYKEDFKKKVMDAFIRSYRSGMTPNPCVECNRHLKFDQLYRRAKILGCDVIVTGHYARIRHDERGVHLLKGLDAGKDQSYVLYALTREQLAHTCFPLGDYSKEEIRAIAEEQGFVNARKRDSQDICFIPDGDYPAFIERVTGKKSPPGDFVDREGHILGKHRGYYCYTIGQRRGLGISAPERLFVTDIDPERNRVVLGSNEDLMAKDLIADDFNWIESVEPGEIIKARIRYHQKESDASVTKLEDGRVRVRFLQAQRAITPGQAVVLYRGETVVGGGTITDQKG